MQQGVVNEIATLAREGQKIDGLFGRVGEHILTSKLLHHLPLKEEAEPKPLAVSTLAALAEYVRANRDKLETGELVLHVASPTEVRLLGPLTGERRQRFAYVAATCVDLGRGFLGGYHEHEGFVVGLQARFVDAGDRASVLAFTRSIKSEVTDETEDDGITQRVTVKRGNHLGATAPVPNPVTLAPYRTFREVAQPESAFVLRVIDGPKVGLHEADGGAWALRAVERVAEWLRGQDLGLPILS